jgi:hypothetical protein
VRRIADYPSSSWCGWTGGVAFPGIQTQFNIAEVELLNDTPLTYDSNGRLITNDAKPDDAKLISDISLSCTQLVRTLVIPAYSTKISLDTSQHATSGLILITPKPGKVCGKIQAQHLPSSVLANLSCTGECIMVGSCEISDIIDPCQFAKMGKSTVQHWFRPPKQSQQTRPLSVSCAAAHEPRPNPNGALQRLQRPSTWLPPITNGGDKAKKVTWWEVSGWPVVWKIARRIWTVFWNVLIITPILVQCGSLLLVGFVAMVFVVATAIIIIIIIMLVGLAC